MKKIALLILFFAALPCLQAQDTTRVQVEPPLELPIYQVMQANVTVHADSAILRLLHDKITGTQRELKQIAGYRVQVYSSNNQQNAKAEAFLVEKKINASSLATQTYVLYNPPFWKVRVGNFRTQEEAALLKEEIITLFPELQGDTYIVRDQIQVIE